MLFTLKERVLQDLIKVQIASQEEVEEQVRKEEEERERLLKSAVFSGVEGKADKPKRKDPKGEAQREKEGCLRAQGPLYLDKGALFERPLPSAHCPPLRPLWFCR
jgi:hypothetical protein